jgi:pSer/pThr/pTyr-binding forkhead associated (FHA) protein
VHEPDGTKARTVRLKGSTQIGREAGCAVRLSDTYVSQVHARLYGENGAWFVEDLGSTNGTFLNDRKVTSAVEVHAGDVVKVGKTVLELRR